MNDNKKSLESLEDLRNKNKELMNENKELKLRLKIPAENTFEIEEEIQNVPVKIRRRNVKEKVDSEEEKLKFRNWIIENVQKTEINTVLIWVNLLTKYLGYKTNTLIRKQFRLYFEEYIKEKFPEIPYEYKRLNFEKQKYYGWKNLICKI